MKRLFLLAALSALVVSASALATTTWTGNGTGDLTYSRAAATTGTEAAPTLASQGFDLTGVRGFTVHLESTTDGDGGKVAWGAGTLYAYLYNPVSERWNRATELDLTVATGGTTAAYSGFAVSAPWGRIAYVPNGLNTAVRIDIVAVR